MNIYKYLKESIDLQKIICDNPQIAQEIVNYVKIIKESLLNGKKLLIAGNGGSAADAQHFAAEITGRFKKERKGYSAIALSTDTSFLTAWSNDYNFDTIFSRQLEAIGRVGDLFFGISTSGNSRNIIEAIKKAKILGIYTICMSGKSGGEIKKIADKCIVIPSENTPRIQEAHIFLIHIICEELEKYLN